MKRLFLISILLLSSVAWGQSLDAADAAYDRKDYATALRAYQSLAARGDAAAQFTLGLMYDLGRGVPQDYVTAHMWFNLAAARGDANGAKGRDIVARLMTPQQIADAQKRARECLAQNYKGC